LQLVKRIEGPLSEDVIPAADVQTGCVDRADVLEHLELVPPRVFETVIEDLVIEESRVLAFEPVDGQRLADRTTLEKGVVVEIRRGHYRSNRAQRRVCTGRRKVLGNGKGRTAEHADIAVAPRLLGQPLDGRSTVVGIVPEDRVVAARIPPPPGVLSNARIAEKGESEARLDPSIPAVRCADQNHRVRTGPERSVYVGGEWRPVIGKDDGGGLPRRRHCRGQSHHQHN
jgi:hypothetical protein